MKYLRSLAAWMRNAWRKKSCHHIFYGWDKTNYKCDRMEGHPGLHSNTKRWANAANR